MDNTIYVHVKKLFDYELYSEVIPLASILRTLQLNDRTTLTIEQEYQLILFQANSYYMERQYNAAIPLYRDSMPLKKQLLLHKNQQLSLIEQNYEQFADTEFKYRLAICLKQTEQPRKAIVILQTCRARTPKLNYLLAKLLHFNNTMNLAKSTFKEVLLECPLALNVIKSLLEIGVNGIEVNSLILNTCSSPQCSDWLSNWIKGHDQMFSRQLNKAAETFQYINETSKIRNNEKLLAKIGEILYYNGNFDSAINYLTNAISINPFLIDGLMALAVLYAKKNRLVELERLAIPSIQIHEYSSEHWFVIAQHLHTDEKHDKAIYFIQKSIIENHRNVEAYLLKAKILCQLHKFEAALDSLKCAQRITNYRFEVYKELAQCFMTMGRLRNGQTVAAQSVRYFKTSPRSYVLLARSLLWAKDMNLTKKAKTFLQKALELDEYYLPAVQTMIETLQSEGMITEAIKLLRKQVSKYPNCKLYATLGDLMVAEKDMDAALDCYTIALNIDASNTQAMDGLNSIGNPPIRPTGGTKKQSTTDPASSLDEPNDDDETNSLDMSEISPPSEREFWSGILDVDLNP